jgi:predicted transcriptional regulator
MLEELLGSKLRLKILLLMLKSGPVYCYEIMQLFEKNMYAVQYQLKRMEKLGVLRSFSAHRRLYYDLDPGYALHEELKAMLEKHLQGLPWSKQSGFYMSPDLRKRERLIEWRW